MNLAKFQTDDWSWNEELIPNTSGYWFNNQHSK